MTRNARAPRRNGAGGIHGESGLTLLEVLVALSVFTVGILAVVNLFPESLRQLQIANQRTISAELAETQMGDLRVTTAQAMFSRRLALSADTLENIGRGDDTYHGPEIFGNEGDASEIYSAAFATMSPLRGSHNSFLQRVTYTVQMPDGREETYVTYLTRQ